MRAPTEPEFQEWMEHPVTRSVMQVLHARREQLRQLWEGGAFSDYTIEGNVLTNVGTLGTCKGYAFVTDLTFEQLESELAE